MLALLNPTSFVTTSGYAAIFVLCVLQSCCVPTSSELTLGIGGLLASEGKLSLPGVIAVGALGELLGAFLAWWIGRSFGRAFVDRFGKYLLLSHRDLDKAENWFRKHNNWGVLVSRLLPVVRNFVALPAGVAEVPLIRFGILTAVGSLVWDGAMALIGYEVGSSWKSVMHGVTDAGYILAALVVAAIVIFFVHRYRSYKSATAHGAGLTFGSSRGRHDLHDRGIPDEPANAPEGGDGALRHVDVPGGAVKSIPVCGLEGGGDLGTEGPAL